MSTEDKKVIKKPKLKSLTIGGKPTSNNSEIKKVVDNDFLEIERKEKEIKEKLLSSVKEAELSSKSKAEKIKVDKEGTKEVVKPKEVKKAKVDIKESKSEKTKPVKSFGDDKKPKKVVVNNKGPQVKKSSLAKDSQERRRSNKVQLTPDLDSVEEKVHSDSAAKRRRQKLKRSQEEEFKSSEKIIRDVVIPENITVADLANRMSERQADVIKELMKMGLIVKPSQMIDADTAELIVSEFGHNFKRVSESDVEDKLLDDIVAQEENMITRAPIVTVMGHVDHGKTSVLDAIKKTDLAGKESGGITQSVGAYSVHLDNGKMVTFLDTPGHAAFTEMRKRGANITDVAVIVVAADDGIMPQTVEAIRHVQAAEVRIVIAINKIDKPGADSNRVQTQLLEHGIQTENFGGDIQCVEISALQNQNIDGLLETILLEAEMLELRSDPTTKAVGIIIDSKLVKGKGIVADVLIKQGTLKTGDIFAAGKGWGKVRSMNNYLNQKCSVASLSEVVEVIGWNEAPFSGDEFVVVDTESKAKEVSDYRIRKEINMRNAVSKNASVDEIFGNLKKENDVKILPIIIKSDISGTCEAVSSAVLKIAEESDELDVKILHAGVGGITETDVNLAASTDATIIAFNTRPNPHAKQLCEEEGVKINYYSVIYNIIDDVRNILSGMLEPTIKENFIGYAEIRKVFKITGSGYIAGCYITEGVVKRGSGVRLLRDDVVIYEGSLRTLKREKEEVKEVKFGYECGVQLNNFEKIMEGDMIECFEQEIIKREL